MAAKDIIHHAVKNALRKDGWKILADPYKISYADRTLSADLKAEKILLAQRNKETIVVEIKSFLGRSFMYDLHTALGQYQVYQAFLEALELDEALYLAISSDVYQREFIDSPAIQMLLRRYAVKLLIVDIFREEVDTWIK